MKQIMKRFLALSFLPGFFPIMSYAIPQSVTQPLLQLIQFTLNTFHAEVLDPTLGYFPEFRVLSVEVRYPGSVPVANNADPFFRVVLRLTANETIPLT
jgi:hypothetical protein